MAVTYGFYDAIDGDRAYNAEEMTSIFDGIILDGIMPDFLNKFEVSAKSTPDMSVSVGSGRAWFDHTWTYNSAALSLNVAASHGTLDRIDAVVLEVNKTSRTNSIYILNGSPSEDPVRPSMENTSNVIRYPLAFISVNHGVTSITNTMISDNRGSTESGFSCPWARLVTDLEGRVVTSVNNQVGDVTITIPTVPSANSTNTNIKAVGAVASAGTLSTFARANHVHRGVPSFNGVSGEPIEFAAGVPQGNITFTTFSGSISSGYKTFTIPDVVLDPSDVNGFYPGHLVLQIWRQTMTEDNFTDDYDVIQLPLLPNRYRNFSGGYYPETVCADIYRSPYQESYYYCRSFFNRHTNNYPSSYPASNNPYFEGIVYNEYTPGTGSTPFDNSSIIRGNHLTGQAAVYGDFGATTLLSYPPDVDTQGTCPTSIRLGDFCWDEDNVYFRMYSDGNGEPFVYHFTVISYWEY